jgi:4-carboxymuconolactone decarboxylase
VTTAEALATVRLGAAAGSDDRDRLLAALESARGLVSADFIEEILLQTYLFAGYPRAINAFFTYQGWVASHGSKRFTRGPESTDPEEWRRRGEDVCRQVYGQNYEALRRRLARLHPALADWTLVEGYGKVLGRSGPGVANRELAAVGTLIAIGAERQLQAHLNGSLNVGVCREVLDAATRQVGVEWGREALVERLLDRLEKDKGR